MTPLGWVVGAVLLVLALVVFWRWRRAEATLRTALDRLRATREEAAALQASSATSAAYLSSLEQAAGPAVFLVDGQQTLLWVNEPARALCVENLSLPAPLGRAVRSFELLDLAGRGLEGEGQSERQFAREGRAYHAQVSLTRTDPKLLMLVLRDVTELQRLGRARRDFVANISHDLRTPITAIQLMVETLQGSAGGDDHRRRQLLSGIMEQTAAIQQLGQEMLDLSLIESGRMPLRLVEIGVADLLEPVLQGMRPQADPKELRLLTHYDRRLHVLADPEHVRRVLRNLVHNAVKFTPPGGSITLGANEAGEDVRIWVQDTGVGIDPDDMPRIFERFFKADRTRSESGTGLGLAIARHIVEAHGGSIWAESTMGKGTTFYFTLPQP